MRTAKRIPIPCLLIVVAMILAGSVASAKVDGTPIKIRPVSEPAVVESWEQYACVLELQAARDVEMTDIRLVADGWNRGRTDLPASLSLAKGGRRAFDFSAVPQTSAGAIGISCEIEGRRYTATFDPAAAYDEFRRGSMGRLVPDDKSTPRVWPDKRFPGPEDPGRVDAFTDDDDALGDKDDRSYSIRVRGQFAYMRGDNIWDGQSGLSYEIYDEDVGVDELLASGELGPAGVLDRTFTWDPGYFDANPDLYVEVFCQNNKLDVQTAWLEWTYGWDTPRVDDYSGTDYDFGLQRADEYEEACHIFRILDNAYPVYADHGYDVGAVDVQWPGESTNYTVFGEIHISDGREWHEDSYLHEFGHHWQHQYTDTLIPEYCNAWCDEGPLWPDCTHCGWCQEEVRTAQQEAFANYLSYLLGKHLRDSMNPGPVHWRYAEIIQPCWDVINDVPCECDPWATEGHLQAFLQDLEDVNLDEDPAFPGYPDYTILDGWTLVSIMDIEKPHTALEWWEPLKSRFPGEWANMWQTGMNNGFNYDSANPDLPTDLHALDHTPGVPSPDATISLDWSEPFDDASGVSGYSVAITEGSHAAPPTTQMFEGSWYVSEPLPPGTYYASVRPFDHAGHFNLSYAVAGPFIVREPFPSDLIFYSQVDWPTMTGPYPDWWFGPGGPPVPPYLTGGAASTVWHFYLQNDGETTIEETFSVRLHVDGEYTHEQLIGFASPGMVLGLANLGPVTVEGGRHTFETRLDALEVFAESDETNNGLAYQYVWSPLYLLQGLDLTRGAPPDPVGGFDEVVNWNGFNSDGFSFSGNGSWDAVYMRTHDEDTFYSMRLHEPSTGPEDGFSAGLAWSSEPPGQLDAVFVNGNQLPVQNWDIAVLNSDGDGDSSFTLRHVESVSLMVKAGFDYFTWQTDDYLSLYDTEVYSHEEGAISVTLQTSAPDQPVHVGWLDQDFTAGDLLDARETVTTDENGFARMDLDVERLGSHGFVVWRDFAVGTDPMDLQIAVFETPPDLVPDTPTDWYAPLVPRPYYAVTPYVVSAPDTLYGNPDDEGNTWLCFAAKNLGPQDAMTVPSRIYLDGELLTNFEWYALLSGIGEKEFTEQGFDVRGGRHTLSYRVDDPNSHWEISETNNIFAEQWVWGPLITDPYDVYHRDRPPDPTGGWEDVQVEGPLGFNCDGLRMPAPVWPDTAGWRAMAVLPDDAANVNIRLHAAAAGVKDGFKTSLAHSSWGPDQIDYLLVRYTETPGPDYDVGVVHVDGEAGYYYNVQGSEKWDVPLGSHGPYGMGQYKLISLFEFDLAPDFYHIILTPLSGYIKWGMSLHDGAQTIHSRASHMPEGTSWFEDAGEAESMIVEVTTAGRYCLTVWTADLMGVWDYGTYAIHINPAETAVEDLPPPASSRVAGIHPNPFNPSTTISYELAEGSRVDLAVYNARGERIRTLVSTFVPAGRHDVTWQGRHDDGRAAASGAYFVRLIAGEVNDVHKMLLLQ